MVSTLVVLALLQSTKFEPVLGGIAESIVGMRPHPEQRLGLYMRRSQINAYMDQRVRQAANDPWIRVGETRTAVKEVKLDGFPCLMLESIATRDVLSHNPMEGERHPRVVRKLNRTRRVWVSDDGSILKTQYEQSVPEAFSIDMLYGDGILVVHKTQNGKRDSARIEVTVDPLQFENEFVGIAWGKEIFKTAKPFSTLDPFAGNVKSFQLKMYGRFEALEGKNRVSGFRVEVTEDKSKVPGTAWVTTDGRLLQYDLPNGDRLIVEPENEEPGITKIRMSG